MIELDDIENYPRSKRLYGGSHGCKIGIIYEGEKCFIKYKRELYSCVEYIASKIYESLDIPVQRVRLAKYKGKVVALITDFRRDDEVFDTYLMLANDYDREAEKYERELNISTNYDDLDNILNKFKHHHYFKEHPELEESFWNMFIVDAFLGNSMRSDEDWGCIRNMETGDFKRVAPVFDNDQAFHGVNIFPDEALDDETSEYATKVLCNYKDGYHEIDRIEYIKTMTNSNCNKALLKIFPKINMNYIKSVINDNDIEVISDKRKNIYIDMLESQYMTLKEVYNKLKEKDDNRKCSN